ncbi:MAG TPA: protoporphyrinogen oxidase [Candidatus Angelobacter sp.]|nr:protoporphyrinogen oxidase [Candidatus Angelobacter sp.]
MKRIAIVGGGIAGLSAAFYLERARRGGAAMDWLLLEKSGRVGGVIRSEQHEGYVLEAGPDSFLTMKPAGAQFCRDLGIADQLISSHDSDRKTYIVVEGQLTPIPEGLEFMVPTRIGPMASTPLFSAGTKMRMAKELFASGGNQKQDESVADFVRRHFGQEMVDRVAEPLLAGIYGGDIDQMSVRAVLPRFAEMEHESGSLVRATLKGRKARAKSTPKPQPLFTTLKNGLQEMVNAAVAALPVDHVRLSQEVTAVERCGAGWVVKTEQRSEPFDAVVMATPAPVTAPLLREANPALVGGLRQIKYSSSAAVVLGYDRPITLPPGHGFLVPRTEGRSMLACTFMHRKFPFRAPEGASLLRCFVSSSRVPDVEHRDDYWLLSTMLAEIRQILAVTETPLFAHIYRWECALPQYSVGHLERVAEMEKILDETPGLHIIGNSFHGIGIPDCIKSGKEAAEKLAQ